MFRMNDKYMSGILVILVPQIVRLIVEAEDVTESEATEAFYNSELYSNLENEETKLWHLSAKALYELYCQERVNGFIDYPEEA